MRFKNMPAILSIVVLISVLFFCKQSPSSQEQGDALFSLQLTGSDGELHNAEITDSTGKQVTIGLLIEPDTEIDSVIVRVVNGTTVEREFRRVFRGGSGETVSFPITFTSAGTRTVEVTGYVTDQPEYITTGKIIVVNKTDVDPGECTPPEPIVPYLVDQNAPGASAVLEAVCDGATFLWSTGETTPKITAKTPGVYTVTVSNECGSVKEQVLFRSLADIGVLDKNGNLTESFFICPGDSLQIKVGGGVSYSWYPTEYLSADDIPDPVATPPVSTRYTVFIATSGGAYIAKTICIVVMDSASVIVNRRIAGCLGSTVTLEAQGADKFIWSPEGGLTCSNCSDPQHIISGNARYKVVAFKGECFVEAYVDIVALPSESIDFSMEREGCVVSLKASEAGYDEYNWDFGDNTTAEGMTVTHEFRGSGSYQIQLTVVSNECGFEQGRAKGLILNEDECSCSGTGAAE